MFRKTITLLFVLSPLLGIHSTFADNRPCTTELLATYTLTVTPKQQHQHDHQHTQASPTGRQETILLWRNSNQSAIEYPAAGITELWEKVDEQRLRLVRNFDHYQRGIEYQPNEIKGAHDWSLKRQLIAETLRKRMQLEHSEGKGCDKKHYYTLQEAGTDYQLTWLPELGIFSEFTINTDTLLSHWQLEAVDTDPTNVRTRFTALSRYDTTDFTDIGDNESDPFLLKMIKLGFVEHGNSGFYDSQGNDIGSHGQHR